MNDLVSIIVPVYNAEAYLDKCIDSIVKQTYKNIEIIIIDDGSRDSSPQICDNWAERDKRIKVIHKQNGGVSSARNIGIKHANGEYICFVDSDDSVVENYFEKCTQKIYDNQLVVCGYNRILGNKTIGEVVFEKQESTSIERKNILRLFEKVLISAPWGKMYHKSIIDSNNLCFPEDLSLGEDMIFNFSYIDKIEKIITINEPLYNYNLDNDNSLLRKYRKDLLKINQRLYGELEKYVSRWGLSDEQMAVYNNSRYFAYVNAMENTFFKENSDGLFTKLNYNKGIIKSKDFKSALKKYNGKLNIGEKIGYALNSYLPILMFSRLVSAVKRVRK